MLLPEDALPSSHTLKLIMRIWNVKHGFCILGCELADEMYKWARTQIMLSTTSLTSIP